MRSVFTVQQGPSLHSADEPCVRAARCICCRMQGLASIQALIASMHRLNELEWDSSNKRSYPKAVLLQDCQRFFPSSVLVMKRKVHCKASPVTSRSLQQPAECEENIALLAWESCFAEFESLRLTCQDNQTRCRARHANRSSTNPSRGIMSRSGTSTPPFTNLFHCGDQRDRARLALFRTDRHARGQLWGSP